MNWKQEWDKRADLHKLLSQTGRFDDALRGAASELDNFVNMLDEFEKAVARSQEFADSAEEVHNESCFVFPRHRNICVFVCVIHEKMKAIKLSFHFV